MLFPTSYVCISSINFIRHRFSRLFCTFLADILNKYLLICISKLAFYRQKYSKNSNKLVFFFFDGKMQFKTEKTVQNGYVRQLRENYVLFTCKTCYLYLLNVNTQPVANYKNSSTSWECVETCSLVTAVVSLPRLC